MNRKFRAGRLILTNDGIIKIVQLANGGGSRYCIWDDKDMDFKTVHHRLLNIFELNNSTYKTSLYNFKCHPLDINAYANLSEYITKHGLNTNSTIIYLCTNESDNDQPKTKDIVETKPSTSKQNSLTPTFLKNQNISKQQQLHKCSIKFGFRTVIKKLIKQINDSTNENNSDELLIQLLENLSKIKIFIFSTITKLQKQLRRPKKLLTKNEILLYTDDINSTYNLCESTKQLITLNKKKFHNLTILSSFSQFFSNLKNLRNQWLENVETISSQINTEDCFELSQTLPSSNLFQSILVCLNDLLNFLHPKHLLKFRELILSAIGDIQSIQSTRNLHDGKTLYDAKQVILSIKNQINQTFYKQDSKSELNQQLDASCRKTLEAIRVLFIVLDRYQMQVN